MEPGLLQNRTKSNRSEAKNARTMAHHGRSTFLPECPGAGRRLAWQRLTRGGRPVAKWASARLHHVAALVIFGPESPSERFVNNQPTVGRRGSAYSADFISRLASPLGQKLPSWLAMGAPMARAQTGEGREQFGASLGERRRRRSICSHDACQWPHQVGSDARWRNLGPPIGGGRLASQLGRKFAAHGPRPSGGRRRVRRARRRQSRARRLVISRTSPQSCPHK